MEPDDYEISVSGNIPRYPSYTYNTAAVSSVKTRDLAQFSTSELLNEAYRRGAIRPFSQRFNIAPFYTQDQNDAKEYMRQVQKNVVHDLLIGNVDIFQKYGAVDMKTRNSMDMDIIEAEIYICKHPKIIKQAGRG